MLKQIIRIQIENSIYDRLMAESVRYAIISLPYTINRMNLIDIQSRITNIAKEIIFIISKKKENIRKYFPSFL